MHLICWSRGDGNVLSFLGSLVLCWRLLYASNLCSSEELKSSFHMLRWRMCSSVSSIIFEYPFLIMPIFHRYRFSDVWDPDIWYYSIRVQLDHCFCFMCWKVAIHLIGCDLFKWRCTSSIFQCILWASISDVRGMLRKSRLVRGYSLFQWRRESQNWIC